MSKIMSNMVHGVLTGDVLHLKEYMFIVRVEMADGKLVQSWPVVYMQD